MDENKTTPTAANAEPAPASAEDAKQTAPAAETQEPRTFDQEQLTRILGERLRAERKKWEKEFAEKLEEERKRAQMEESERLRLEKLDLEKQLHEIQHQRRQAEAKAELLRAGLDPQHLDIALKIYLASGNEETELPDAQAFLNQFPVFKPAPPSTPPTTAGFRPAGGEAYHGDLDELARKDPAQFNKIWEAQLNRRK